MDNETAENVRDVGKFIMTGIMILVISLILLYIFPSVITIVLIYFSLGGLYYLKYPNSKY